MNKSEPINSYIQPLRNIDCYGSHVSFIQGIKGRVSSLLHWNTQYDKRNLAHYRITWAQQQSKDSKFLEDLPKEFEDLFANLESQMKDFEAFTKANSRHLSRIVDVFKENKEKLESAFSTYNKLVGSSGFDFDAFIAATSKVLAETKDENEDVQDSIQADMKARLLEADFSSQLKDSMFNGIIWETGIAFWVHKYNARPAINRYLNALTAALGLSGIWAFASGIAFAEFAVALFGPALKAAYNTGSIHGSIAAIIEEWNRRIEDDNTFHPLIEIAIVSLYIPISWLHLDKLQNAAKAGDTLHSLMQWGIRGSVLRYSTMHFFFALKAELHKGNFFSISPLISGIMGAIRGAIKNPLVAMSLATQARFKLPEALTSQQLGCDYLNSWAASVPKTFISSPEWLLTCLWVAKDLWEGFITNLSLAIMKSLNHLLPDSTEIRKNISVRTLILLSSLMVLAFAYYWQLTQHSLNTSNSSTTA